MPRAPAARRDSLTVVVGDAVFCQCDLCEQILAAEGHYVLAVKENQPTLHREISQAFTAADAAFSSLGAM